MTEQIAALTAMIDEAARAHEAKPAGAPPPTVERSGPSFAEVLAQVSLDAAGSLRGAEAASINGLHGKASTLEVVQAITEAEQALSTAVAVRDKAVAAYQEISRMAI